MEHAERDRYSSLVRALQAGREVPVAARRRGPSMWDWHPIARRLLMAIVAAVVVYYGARFAWNAVRDARVDTWSGPDATVQSGQRLAGCPAVDALHDDTFPNWVRYGGAVYVLTGRYRPIGGDASPGRTTLAEAGYSNGTMRLLLTETPGSGPPDESLYLRPPSLAGQP